MKSSHGDGLIYLLSTNLTSIGARCVEEATLPTAYKSFEYLNSYQGARDLTWKNHISMCGRGLVKRISDYSQT